MGRPRKSRVEERPLADGSIAFVSKLTVAVGDRRNVVLGHSRDGMTESLAREELERQEAQVKLGLWQDSSARPATGQDGATFHEFATDWWERKQLKLKENTRSDYKWRLSSHLAPFFGPHPVSAIDIDLVDKYKAQKLRERKRFQDAIGAGRPLRDSRGQTITGLSNTSINMTLELLGAILWSAMKRNLTASNPAVGKGRRLREKAPRRTWLMPDEVLDLIDAAERIDRVNKPVTVERNKRVKQLQEESGWSLTRIAADLDLAISTTSRIARLQIPDREPSVRRAIVATLALAGLRASELCALRWRHLNFTNRTIDVPGTKTDTAANTVKMTDFLRDELLRWKADAPATGAGHLVFPTSRGTQQTRHNLRSRVIAPAVKEANRSRDARGLTPTADGITPHSMRRAFVALLLAYGRPVPYVQRQVRHADARTTLNIYAQVVNTDFASTRGLLALLCRREDEDSGPGVGHERPVVAPSRPARRVASSAATSTGRVSATAGTLARVPARMTFTQTVPRPLPAERMPVGAGTRGA